MADSQGLPHGQFYRAYSKWAKGGWGMIFTGNVFVDPAYLGNTLEVSIPSIIDTKARTALKKWCQSCSSEGTPTLMQLNHPGRQSILCAGKRSVFAKTLAPSAVPLNLGSGIIPKTARVVLFGTPREMSSVDIETVISQFATAARVAAEAGFAGVELHAAHGYLLSQFLSKKTNLRQDAWGGDATKRARIVVEIINGIRKVVPKGFAVGVKVNSVDHQDDKEMGDSLIQLKSIVDVGVDFIEVSGGSWEDPKACVMMQPNMPPPSARTHAREAFFLSFAKAIREHFSDVPLIVTGGFRSRVGMASAVQEGDCDLIGLARPAVLNPELPKNKIFNAEVHEAEKLYTENLEKPLLERLIGNRVAGAGAESANATTLSMPHKRQADRQGYLEEDPKKKVQTPKKKT
ncbi:putative FMN binding oxidoreductase [Dactylonectria macrodidyma]|uniref:FMN binding oxidoreductase n=1 Tax=Dactylonectria macrodidyma TaxID=307937 RepID=A0A9P9DRV2_9HYPO|nr:putative FMN binding oxidoreductase [Dactylonectria macrodidyma]